MMEADGGGCRVSLQENRKQRCSQWIEPEREVQLSSPLTTASSNTGKLTTLILFESDKQFKLIVQT